MHLGWRVEGKHLITDALRVEGRRRRGRLKLKWEDCIKGDLVGVGRVWRMRARVRGEWRRFLETAVTKEKERKNIDNWYQCQPHPGLEGYRGEEQHVEYN